MSALFEIKITAIRTASLGMLSDVVRRVEFIVRGVQAGQVFELPQQVELADPADGPFIELTQLSEADVVRFVEDNFHNMSAVKAHIQYVLDRNTQIALLEEKPLPWAPPPAPEGTSSEDEPSIVE